MGEAKTSGVFIALNLILFVLFLELIPIVFNLGGRAFAGELVLLAVFLAAALVLMFTLYHNIDWAFLGLLIFFAANLINTLFLYFNYQFRLTTAIVLAGLGILGLIISVIKIDFSRRPKEEQLTLDDEFDKPIPDNVKIIPEEDFDIVGEKKATKKATAMKKSSMKKSSRKSGSNKKRAKKK